MNIRKQLMIRVKAGHKTGGQKSELFNKIIAPCEIGSTETTD